MWCFLTSILSGAPQPLNVGKHCTLSSCGKTINSIINSCIFTVYRSKFIGLIGQKQTFQLSFVIIFHVKFQHKTINLSFWVVFASIKLPRHDIPKNNYRLNDTIIFFGYRVVSFHIVHQNSVTADPYCD